MESREDVDLMAEGRVKVATEARRAATGQRLIVPTMTALTNATDVRATGFGPNSTADDQPVPSPPPPLESRCRGATATDAATAEDPLSAATIPTSPIPTPIEQAITITVVITKWPCPVGMTRVQIR
jgi:hypothetical protein